MKKSRKVLIVSIIILVLVLASITAFAGTSYKTPADALAGITGRDSVRLREERRERGKSFGALVTEAGKLEEFRLEKFKMKEAIIKQKLEEGRITQEEADSMLEKLETRQVECDGSGSQPKREQKRLGKGQGNKG